MENLGVVISFIDSYWWALFLLSRLTIIVESLYAYDKDEMIRVKRFFAYGQGDLSADMVKYADGKIAPMNRIIAFARFLSTIFLTAFRLSIFINVFTWIHGLFV